MIIDVWHTGWGADSKLFVETMRKEDIPVFTKDAEGNPVALSGEATVTYETPLMIELHTATDFALLAKHFDVMLRDRPKSGTVLYIDSKGGGFKQR